MRWRRPWLQELGSRARQWPGVGQLAGHLGLAGPLILTYHRVSSTREGALASKSHTVSLDHLHRQIRHVAKTRTWVSLPELLQAGPRRWHKLASMVFDDGHRSYLLGHDLLRTEGLRPTLAIVPDLVEGKAFWRDRIVELIEAGRGAELTQALGLQGDPYQATKSGIATHDVLRVLEVLAPSADQPGAYLNTSELRKVSSQVDLVNHSYSHPVLSTLTASQQEAEIGSAQDWLRRELPSALTEVFVVPFGGERDWNLDSRHAAQKLGVRFVLTNGRRWAPRNTDPQWITRTMPREEDFAKA